MKSFQKELKDYNKEKCEIFGFLGIIHQLILGLLTFSLLLLKRYLEKPRRHLTIWLYDMLKQMISSCALYSSNIIFTYLLSNKKEENSDLCTIYFINLFLGCIVGYFITSLYIRLFYYINNAYKLNCYFNEIYYEEIYINNNEKYFRIKKRIYISEVIFWVSVQLIWKFMQLIFFSYFKFEFIAFGELCLKPFNNIHIKSFMILCFFPLVFNGFYYWKLDNLIKVKKAKKYVTIKTNEEEKV